VLCEEFGAVKLKRACDDFVELVAVGPAVDFRFGNTEGELEEAEEKVCDINQLKTQLALLTR
jgi:hypothetical protein